jgi:hypothetical protein
MLQHSLRRGAAARACHTNDSARSHARRAHPLLTAGAYRTRCAQRLLPRAGQEFYGYDQPMAPMYEQPVFEYEQPMPMQVQYVEQPHYEMMPMQVATSPMPVQYVEPMPMPMPMPMPPAPAPPPPPPPVYKKKQGNSCRCGSPAHSPRLRLRRAARSSHGASCVCRVVRSGFASGPSASSCRALSCSSAGC